MDNILRVREAIYACFQSSEAIKKYFFRNENADAYAAYYTSMYLVQDSGEAVWSHIRQGFSTDPMQAYIEFWGVMQAIIIQQDAVIEMHRAVLGERPDVSKLPAWQQLRNTRNLCAGHPAKQAHGVPSPRRAFIGRTPKTYECISFEMWDSHTQNTTYPKINLGKMIREYDEEASKVLEDILDAMQSQR